jgi:hypothetical protein
MSNNCLPEKQQKSARRKAEIKQFIEFADKAKTHSEEVTWLRHAVRGLFAEVFDE